MNILNSSLEKVLNLLYQKNLTKTKGFLPKDFYLKIINMLDKDINTINYYYYHNNAQRFYHNNAQRMGILHDK